MAVSESGYLTRLSIKIKNKELHGVYKSNAQFLGCVRFFLVKEKLSVNDPIEIIDKEIICSMVQLREYESQFGSVNVNNKEDINRLKGWLIDND